MGNLRHELNVRLGDVNASKGANLEALREILAGGRVLLRQDGQHAGLSWDAAKGQAVADDQLEGWVWALELVPEAHLATAQVKDIKNISASPSAYPGHATIERLLTLLRKVSPTAKSLPDPEPARTSRWPHWMRRRGRLPSASRADISSSADTRSWEPWGIDKHKTDLSDMPKRKPLGQPLGLGSPSPGGMRTPPVGPGASPPPKSAGLDDLRKAPLITGLDADLNRIEHREIYEAAPTVTVIGAGVTGLTAAHELVERGFNVQVVEVQEEELLPGAVQVGGVAATPLRRLPEPTPGTLTPSQPPIRLVSKGFPGRLRVTEAGWVGLPNRLKRVGSVDEDEVVELCPSRLAEALRGALDRRVQESPDGRVWCGTALRRVRVQVVGLYTGTSGFEKAQLRARRALGEIVRLALHPQAEIQGWWRVAEPRAARELRGNRRGVALAEAVLVYMCRVSPDGGIGLVQVELRTQVESLIDPAGFRGTSRERDVELRVEQYLAATEHGYRVFPGFYQHMFDSMARIPLFDVFGKWTGRTALGLLVPVRQVVLVKAANGDDAKDADAKDADAKSSSARGDQRRTAHQDLYPQTLAAPRRRLASFGELRKLIRGMKAFKFNDRDLALFDLRLFKYLTSCKGRRRAEASPKDWEEYFRIQDFSKEFRDTLKDSPLSLLSARADEVDARTMLNVTVQLLLDHVREGRPSDRTLNGPTSEVLFKPWKDYLRFQGVLFFRGELTGLSRPKAPMGEAQDDPRRLQRLEPRWGRNGEETPQPEYPRMLDAPQYFDNTPDYYVLAVPLNRLWELLEEPKTYDEALGPDLQRIAAWRELAHKELRAVMVQEGKAENELSPQEVRRLLGLGAVQKANGAGWKSAGPFRVMSGIQYYFASGIRVGGRGHIYYIGAPWGISTISQPAYWRTRVLDDREGYVSNLSVDVCHWYDTNGSTKYEFQQMGAALDQTPTDLALKTWFQIVAFQSKHKMAKLDQPIWFSADELLVRGEDGQVRENRAPYLINRACDWDLRAPAVFPEELGGADERDEDDEDDDTDSQGKPHPPSSHPEGRTRSYAANYGQWFIAGPHMKTNTRITSMEAANESARRAVNGILRHFAAKSDGVFMGELCHIYDPENAELSDLRPLRELDRKLFQKKDDQGRPLPHLVDILKLESLVMEGESDALSKIHEVLMGAWEDGLSDLREESIGLGPLAKSLEALREHLERWLKG